MLRHRNNERLVGKIWKKMNLDNEKENEINLFQQQNTTIGTDDTIYF